MFVRAVAIGRATAVLLGSLLFVPTVYGAFVLGGGNDCAKCHPINPIFSHPVGVLPSMRVPNNLPLEHGQLTCMTCHVISGPDHAMDGKALLREPASQLCNSCHQNTPLRDRLRHGANIGRAHLARSSRTTKATGELDAESHNCMSCHDGALANDAGTIRSTELSAIDSEHPVGNVYEIPLRDSSLAAPAMLNSRVRLFDGKVGCGSCHSPYSPHKAQLVIPNQNAALCMSCHQM